MPKRQADAAAPAPNGAEPPTRRGRGRRWTFLSSHAQVLLCLARAPDQRLTEIAARVGITERAVQMILRDLIREGFLNRTRVGRCNVYEVRAEQPLRHPFVAHRELRDLLELLDDERPAAGP